MGTTRLIRNHRWGPCLLVTSSGRGFRPPPELFTGYKISECGTPSGIIHDSLSVGCNSVDNGCGYTYTGQQWVWCNGTTNTVIGTVGDLVVHDNAISVGGSYTSIKGNVIKP